MPEPARPVDPKTLSKGGKGIGKGKDKIGSSQGTSFVTKLDTVVLQFPFNESSDSDIVHLFESSGFSLGKTDVIRLQAVDRFRKIMKDWCVNIIDTVKEKENSLVLRDCTDLLHITEEVFKVPTNALIFLMVNIIS
jgi:hypothetical protein